MLFYAASGSAAQGLFVFVVAFLGRMPTVQARTVLSLFSAEFVAVSILLAFVSLVPLGRGSTNDGSRIARLLIDKSYVRRRMSIVSLGVQQRNGVRARNWKQTWLRAALFPRDDSPEEFAGNLLAYINSNALKKETLAGAYMERCLELSAKLGTETRYFLAREVAIYCAWFRRDAILAQKWLTQAHGKPQEAIAAIRIRVAMHCVHQDYTSALDTWNEGMRVIEGLPKRLSTENLREGWTEWRDEIYERQAGLAAATAATKVAT